MVSEIPEIWILQVLLSTKLRIYRKGAALPEDWFDDGWAHRVADLEEVGGFDESQSKSILKKLESEGFLITNFKGEVRFAHDKIQEVLLTSIPEEEKAFIYEALAQEYEALSDTKWSICLMPLKLFAKPKGWTRR